MVILLDLLFEVVGGGKVGSRPLLFWLTGGVRGVSEI